jgi:hypothetical protein
MSQKSAVSQIATLVTAADAWEKRMAEGVAFLARMKAEAARG